MVKWVIIKQDLASHLETDPPWEKSFSYLSDFEDVEVIIVYGEWPVASERIWKLNFFKVAIHINQEM